MAENKKSFLLYCDLIHTVEKMPDDKAGQLLKHLLRYTNDLNPETDDLIVQLAFEPIKQQLKRDLKKFKSKCDKNRENILKRWNKKDTNVYERIPADTKNTDSDNDTDNDNELSKDNNITLSVNWSKLLEQFNSITGKKIRVLNQKAKRQILARLKEGYSKEDFVQAIVNCFNDSYHRETGHKYLTLEFISRADKMEKYANINPDFKPKQERL